MPNVEPKVVTIEEQLNKLNMVYEEKELAPFVCEDELTDDESTDEDKPTEEEKPASDDEGETSEE